MVKNEKNSILILAIVAIVAIVGIVILISNINNQNKYLEENNIVGQASACQACEGAGCPGHCNLVCPGCGATSEDLKKYSES